MDEELRHLFLGQVLKRIRNFCDKYDSDGDPIVMSHEVERDFTKERDHEFLILIAVNEELKVVGHLLANAYSYYGKLYICVSQMELDQGLSLDSEKKAFAVIKQWQGEIGARGIRAAAPSALHIRRLKMLHGAETSLTTMRL